MADLVVAREDKRSFLDKVIAFGIDHNLLTLDGRRVMAQQSAELVPSLARQTDLNDMDIGEALQAAKFVTNLTSIALERASQGNVMQAAALLAARPVAELAMSVLNLMADNLKRVQKIYHGAVGRVYTAKFDYSITLWRVNFREAPPLCLGKDYDVISQSRRLHESLARLRTAADLEQWLVELDALEYELEISQRFLPWEQLKDETELKSVAVLPTVRTIKDFLHDERVTQNDWTPSTLLATMTATLICGGTWRRVGTVFPVGHLSNLAGAIRQSNVFRARGRIVFLDYLKYLKDVHERGRAMDKRAEEYLLGMWEKAMDQLLFVPRGATIRSFNLLTWFSRIHLAAPGQKIQDAVFRNECRDAAAVHGRKGLVEKIVDLGDNPSKQRLAALLSRAKWGLVQDEDFISLMRLAPAELLIRHMPLGFGFESLLVAQWKEPGIDWTLEHRRQFIARLLEEAGADFWRKCQEEVLQLLLAVHPEDAGKIRWQASRYRQQ